MPLGHDLRADDDVHLPAFDLADDLAHLFEPRNEVGRKQSHARLGKPLPHLFGHALNPRTARHKRALFMALRTRLRHRQREAAMMAVEPPAKTMLDEPRRALRTFDPMTARPAQRQRRITPAIEKQQRLLALCQRFRQRTDQHRRKPLPFFGRVAPQIDRLDVGKIRPSKAPGKHHLPITPDARVDMAFDRGRRRRQHHRKLAEAAAHHAHVARLIMHPVVLLEARIVLFVDDDEPEIGIGQKQRGSCPHDHVRLS